MARNASTVVPAQPGRPASSVARSLGTFRTRSAALTVFGCAMTVLVAAGCSQSSPPQRSSVDPFLPLVDGQDRAASQPLYPPLRDPFAGQSLVFARHSDGVVRPTVFTPDSMQVQGDAAFEDETDGFAPSRADLGTSRYDVAQYDAGAAEARPDLGGPVESYRPMATSVSSERTRPGERVLFSIPQGAGNASSAAPSLAPVAVAQAPLPPPEPLSYGNDPLDPLSSSTVERSQTALASDIPQAASGELVWRPAPPDSQRVDHPTIFTNAPASEPALPSLGAPHATATPQGASLPPLPAYAAEPAAAGPSAVGFGGSGSYVVKPGDTVFAVSRLTGAAVKDIIAVNGLSAPYHLQLGQTLQIPGVGTNPQTALRPSDLAPVRAPDPVPTDGLPSAVGGPLSTLAPPLADPGSPLYAVDASARQNDPGGPPPTAAPTSADPSSITLLPSPKAPQAPSALSPVYVPKTEAPAGRQHEVGAGDTLYAIARAYDVTVAGIVGLNGLVSPYNIRPGQVLAIPSEAEAVTASASRASASLPLVDAVSALPPPGAASDRGQDRPAQTNQSAGPARPTLPPLPERTLDLSSLDLGPAETSVPPRAGQTFMWPLAEGKVVTRFGSDDGGRRSKGIDIDAPLGAAVSAAENGLVVYADSDVNGFGKLLILQHADGFVSVYGHNDALLVSKGHQVRKGDVIAFVGQTGSTSTPKLHFQIRLEGQPIDPMPLLDGNKLVASR